MNTFRKLYSLVTKNTFIHLCVIAIAVIPVMAFKNVYYLFLYPMTQLLIDVLYYFFNIGIYDSEVAIQTGYHVSKYFNDTLHSQGVDYGFNFYDGDYKKDRRQAQIDKFEYAIKELELKRGMSLIDIGCGCGDWLKYFQDKGMKVVGVNITKGQVEECLKRGLEVYHINWKKLEYDAVLKEKLYGQFDRVTFWDSVEHFVPARLTRNSLKSKQDEIYESMYRMAKNLLKSGGKGKIFISCLHLRRHFFSLPWWSRIKKLSYGLVLDKFHSGSYPTYSDDQLVRTAKPLFRLVRRKDTTMDYYMTSVLEKTHFGRHKFNMTLERAVILLSFIVLDPFWLYRYIWFFTEDWMCQFDGQNINNSDMINWWLTFQEA